MHYKLKIWTEDNDVFPIIDTVIVEELTFDSDEKRIFLTQAKAALEFATNQRCFAELEEIN